MSASREYRLAEEIRIRAPRERVFAALTEPEHLTTWWTLPDRYETQQAEVDLRVGGAYRLTGVSSARGRFEVRGEYLSIERPAHLRYTWCPDWDERSHDSVVDIRLLEVGPDETRVVVEHSAFPAEASRDAHRQGWPAVLAALREHLEPAPS